MFFAYSKLLNQLNISQIANNCLLKIVNEKQHLLCDALKAIELLEQEKIIKEQELNEKIENLNRKILTLQESHNHADMFTETNCKSQLKLLIEKLQKQIRKLEKQSGLDTAQLTASSLIPSSKNYQVRKKSNNCGLVNLKIQINFQCSNLMGKTP